MIIGSYSVFEARVGPFGMKCQRWHDAAPRRCPPTWARRCLVSGLHALRGAVVLMFIGSASAASLLYAPTASVHPELWPAGAHDLSSHPAIEAFVAQLLAHMSVEEKVAQMIQADIASVSP